MSQVSDSVTVSDSSTSQDPASDSKSKDSSSNKKLLQLALQSTFVTSIGLGFGVLAFRRKRKALIQEILRKEPGKYRLAESHNHNDKQKYQQQLYCQQQQQYCDDDFDDDCAALGLDPSSTTGGSNITTHMMASSKDSNLSSSQQLQQSKTSRANSSFRFKGILSYAVERMMLSRTMKKQIEVQQQSQNQTQTVLASEVTAGQNATVTAEELQLLAEKRKKYPNLYHDVVPISKESETNIIKNDGNQTQASQDKSDSSIKLTDSESNSNSDSDKSPPVQPILLDPRLTSLFTPSEIAYLLLAPACVILSVTGSLVVLVKKMTGLESIDQAVKEWRWAVMGEEGRPRSVCG